MMLQWLKEEYGYNNPIFLAEIKREDMTSEAIRQSLSRLVKSGQLERYGQGIYYISTETILGKSLISARKVCEKKYISDKEEVYGYTSGLALENEIGLTTQMPNIIEIVSNKEKSRVRRVKVGSRKVKLRGARTAVTASNQRVLQFLELFNKKRRQELRQDQKKCIVKFAKEQNVRKEDVYQYIGYYPARVAKNLIRSGIIDELR